MNFVIFFAFISIFALNCFIFANPNSNWDVLKCSGNKIGFVRDNEIFEEITIKEFAEIRISVPDDANNDVIVSGTDLNGKSLISKIKFAANYSYTFQAIVIESTIKDMSYNAKTKDLFWFNGTSLKMKTIDDSTTKVFQLQNVLSMKIHTSKNDLYWIEKSNRKQIKKINIKKFESKNDMELVYKGSSIINSIDIDYKEEYLFLVEKSGIYFEIKKYNLSNGLVTLIYQGTDNNPAKLKAIDENFMFWISDQKLYQFTNGFGYKKLFDSEISDFAVNKPMLFEKLRLIDVRKSTQNLEMSMPCTKTCLNKAKCVVDGNFTETCKCSGVFYGEFCQFKIDVPKLCASLCQFQTFESDDQLLTFCNCKANKTVIISTFINRTLEMLKVVLLNNKDLSLPDPINYDSYYTDKIITILSLTIVVLFLVIVLMAFKVFCLKTNTRVRKRYLINKNNSKHPDGQTEHCEIEIENCCNMNICETPCFEPMQLKSVNGATKKVEDKRKLINHMEN